MNRHTAVLKVLSANITPDLVDVVSFIKYIKMNLDTADDILPFYNNVYAQVARYNSVIVPCAKVSTTTGVLIQDLPLNTQDIIVTALGTAFREEVFMSKSFAIAHNLLLTISSRS